MLLEEIITEITEDKMTDNSQLNNPLHGIRLIDILEYLVDEYGWEELGYEININCFTNNPSIKSSLKFLRKTDWARKKVEKLFIDALEFGKIVL